MKTIEDAISSRVGKGVNKWVSKNMKPNGKLLPTSKSGPNPLGSYVKSRNKIVGDGLVDEEQVSRLRYKDLDKGRKEKLKELIGLVKEKFPKG